MFYKGFGQLRFAISIVVINFGSTVSVTWTANDQFIF